MEKLQHALLYDFGYLVILLLSPVFVYDVDWYQSKINVIYKIIRGSAIYTDHASNY